jgi:hypothetical protein
MDLQEQKLIVTLLLSVLSSTIIVGMLAAFLILRWRHSRGTSVSRQVLQKQTSPAEASHAHFLLKQPNCWLAIKNRNLIAVQSALALHNPKPCTWLEGLSGDDAQKLFISPPVSGWTLVIGPALPDPSDDVDVCFRFLLDLSQKLGHIQFFQASGIVDHHAWVRAEDGRILRGYAWAGKTLWNQGSLTQAERELRMRCYDYGENPEGRQFGAGESGLNNSDKLHLLAARWSVDPDEIDERFIEQEWGIVGEPSRRY